MTRTGSISEQDNRKSQSNVMEGDLFMFILWSMFVDFMLFLIWYEALLELIDK